MRRKKAGKRGCCRSGNPAVVRATVSWVQTGGIVAFSVRSNKLPSAPACEAFDRALEALATYIRDKVAVVVPATTFTTAGAGGLAVKTMSIQ
jgi:hypothetical protein